MRETVAAGAWVGGVLLILSATGLVRWLTVHIPVPVVKGIQLGAGISLVISAGSSLIGPLGWVSPALDNRLWALAAFLGLLATQRLARFPYALVVFLVGLVLSVFVLVLQDRHRLPAFALWLPRLYLPNFLSSEAAGMAIAQLPLTALNSVIAVAALAADLFPDLPAPTTTSLGLSVAAMNLLGCWLGAMPVCHGAGGLAAQYRFGARSGASIVLLGAFKVLLGLLFGETLVELLGAFPHSLLGVMVLASGLELARVGAELNHGAADLWESSVEGAGGVLRRHRNLSEQERAERWTVMLMTTAGMLAFKNTAVGFAAGMLCYWSYRLVDYIERRRGSNPLSGERSPLLR